MIAFSYCFSSNKYFFKLEKKFKNMNEFKINTDYLNFRLHALKFDNLIVKSFFNEIKI